MRGPWPWSLAELVFVGPHRKLCFPSMSVQEVAGPRSHAEGREFAPHRTVECYGVCLESCEDTVASLSAYRACVHMSVGLTGICLLPWAAT